MALQHLSWELFKALTDDISPFFFFFFRACRVLQGWQIEKRFPVSRRKKPFQSKLQIRELPCLCLQPFYDRKLSSYPKIFNLRGENSTRSSRVSCPGSFQWTDQSKNGAGAEARAIKLSQHSWRYTVTGTDFLCEAVFSPHTGRFCALEKCFDSCYFFFFLPYFRIAFATPNPPINLKLCYLYRDPRTQYDTTACWVWGICSDSWYL